jgi:hypothetical protein
VGGSYANGLKYLGAPDKSTGLTAAVSSTLRICERRVANPTCYCLGR